MIGAPLIKIKNTIAEEDYVAVEGEVQCQLKAGGTLDASFIDMYHLENGKVKEMRSYVIEKKK